jgi:hypothetical protein
VATHTLAMSEPLQSSNREVSLAADIVTYYAAFGRDASGGSSSEGQAIAKGTGTG